MIIECWKIEMNRKMFVFSNTQISVKSRGVRVRRAKYICILFKCAKIFEVTWQQIVYEMLRVVNRKEPWQAIREATKKKGKIFHNKCELSPKMENPPLPLFHNNFSRFRNLKIDVFLQLLRVCEWGGLTKSLSKISLKSSSKQTDYEKSFHHSVSHLVWYI